MKFGLKVTKKVNIKVIFFLKLFFAPVLAAHWSNFYLCNLFSCLSQLYEFSTCIRFSRIYVQNMIYCLLSLRIVDTSLGLSWLWLLNSYMMHVFLFSQGNHWLIHHCCITGLWVPWTHIKYEIESWLWHSKWTWSKPEISSSFWYHIRKARIR